MRKTTLLVAFLLLISALPVLAAQTRVAPASPSVTTPYIPMYPGATMLAEVNVSDKDVLGMVKQAVSAFASTKMQSQGEEGQVEKMIESLDLKGLYDALSGVNHVRAVYARLPKLDQQKLIAYYDKALSKGPWTRVFFNTATPGQAQAVYALPNSQGFFAVVGMQRGSECQIVLTRTVGFVDMAKAGAWFKKNLPLLSQMRPMPKAVEPKKDTPKP